MAFEAVRGYLLASGLGEMTKAKALETAQGLLALPAEEVGKRALQASALADQLLEAARANREHLVALVRGEIEAAMGRADLPATRSSRRHAPPWLPLPARSTSRGPRFPGASRSPLGKALGVGRPPSARDGDPSSPPPEAPGGGDRAADGEEGDGEKATAKKRPPRRRRRRSATAEKATAKKATATKATAKKATAKKATAKKATAKTAEKATARRPRRQRRRRRLRPDDDRGDGRR